MTSTDQTPSMLNKVPAVTLAFWVIKIAATTVGETGGDALSMTLNLGYLVSTYIFAGIFVVVLIGQLAARRFHPFLYWAVIVATTTTGTTISDYLDRDAGLGYPRASALLFTGVLLSLGLWRLTTGSVSVSRITTRRAEFFYWITILISNTLGTALGDFTADSMSTGFEGGALIFGAALVVIAALYFFTGISRTFLFWAAFILTRPLGATLGDILTKPVHDGGLNLDRIMASLVIAVFMIACILFTRRQSEQPLEAAS
jgi:uncharacterized membrane-anchored protein